MLTIKYVQFAPGGTEVIESQLTPVRGTVRVARHKDRVTLKYDNGIEDVSIDVGSEQNELDWHAAYILNANGKTVDILRFVR